MTELARRRLDESLGFNLHRAAQLYRRELVRALSEHDLTPEQWQILATLTSVRERLSQGEIAAITFNDRPSVSRMIDRLEASGWVVRHPNPVDARAFCIGLGAREQEIGGIRIKLAAHFSRIDSVLTRSQKSELLGLLRLLRNHLGDQETPPP